jgi:hypothetical protein
MRSLARSATRILLALAILLTIGIALLRQPILRGRAYDASVRADPAMLRAHVEFLTTQISPRSADHPEQLERAAAAIARTFTAAGARVSMQEFDARGRHYRNVVARFGPEPSIEHPLLLVGAHYDAFCTGEALPGADDNASGTAALLELARLLGTQNIQRPLMLVAYTNEEPPFFGSAQMGSAVHAASLARDRIPVTGMICLEMIGYYAKTQRWPNWTFELLYPSRGDFIAVGGGWNDRALVRQVKSGIRGAGGIRVLSFTGPRETLDASDQRNYWLEGWPAVLVTDTAFLRNPNYHTRNDTAKTLDYVRMARVVDGVFNAIR